MSDYETADAGYSVYYIPNVIYNGLLGFLLVTYVGIGLGLHSGLCSGGCWSRNVYIIVAVVN